MKVRVAIIGYLTKLANEVAPESAFAKELTTIWCDAKWEQLLKSMSKVKV